MPVSQQHLTEIQILSMRVLSFHKIFSMSVQLIEYQDGSLMVEGVSVWHSTRNRADYINVKA